MCIENRHCVLCRHNRRVRGRPAASLGTHTGKFVADRSVRAGHAPSELGPRAQNQLLALLQHTFTDHSQAACLGSHAVGEETRALGAPEAHTHDLYEVQPPYGQLYRKFVRCTWGTSSECKQFPVTNRMAKEFIPCPYLVRVSCPC